MHEFRVRPGTRAVVVGEGDDAADIVTELGACGISVFAHLAPAETHRVLGAPSVCQVESDNRRFDVDLVVVAAGRQPDPELASQVGCEMTYSSLDQAFVPRRDSAMRTSVPWVFAAGDSCGSCSPAEAWHEGRVAGLAATGSTGQSSAIAELDRVRSSQRRNENDISFQISDDTRVCRCEEIDATSIRAAIQAGARSVSEVKRWTRAGMGMCQGIYCTGSITALLRDEGGLPADSLEPMTARPPARVVPIAAFVDGWDES
jgi:NAD(P)H-nitrite reductase large subunit